MVWTARLLIGAALLACGMAQASATKLRAPPACTVPAGWKIMAPADFGPFQVAAQLPQRPIAVGQPFNINVVVCRDSQMTIDRLTMDAIMPRHRHGMNYQVAISKRAIDRYHGQAFLFHMPGSWQIIVTVYKGGKPHRLTLDVQVE